MNHEESGLRDTGLKLSKSVLIAFMFGYQISILVYQFQGALELYYFHLGLVLTVVVLTLAGECEPILSGWKGRARLAVLGIVLIASLLSCGYLYLNITDIELRQPFLETADLYAGAVVVACVVILTQMVWGTVLATLITLAIVYFFLGDYFPGNFNFNPPETEIIISYLAGMGGARGIIWGIPLSANTLFLIIVFGGLLKGTRILELFNEVGRLLMNVTRGGVCYSAIMASTAIGMVTGQAVANVALSGSVTIPSMKQRGISGERAGAIEVVASLGSQLIPPIMGLGGFLMAVNLGVPYADIATAAIVPAALFVIILFIAAYFVSAATPALNIQKEAVNRRLILWVLPSFLISFLGLLTLLYLRYSPGYSALWAIALLLVSSFIRAKEFRPGFRQLWDGLVYGVVSACYLGLILAGIGVIVQVLVTTGAGFDFGRLMMQAAGGEIFIALLLGMMISLLAGLGLPTPAAYALIAIIMVPFLIDIGIEPLVAHFFGFYFAIFSAITPPVAVGVMAATRISGGSFYGTAYEAMRMSLIAILIPYAFVAFPSLLAFPAIGFDGLIVSVALVVASIFWGASIYGVLKNDLSISQRCLFLLVPLAFIVLIGTRNILFAIAIVVAGIVFFSWNSIQNRRRQSIV
jgi:TRAP transporter 4TM/12TM fusion protein